MTTGNNKGPFVLTRRHVDERNFSAGTSIIPVMDESEVHGSASSSAAVLNEDSGAGAEPRGRFVGGRRCSNRIAG